LATQSHADERRCMGRKGRDFSARKFSYSIRLFPFESGIRFIWATWVLWAICVPANVMFSDVKLQVGDSAPELKLKDQHGNLVFLRDYAGKWVVLYFYPKDDTPGCTREACRFRDETQQLAPFNVQVIGVSVDDRESHEKFARKFKLSFPLLADPTKKVTKAYGALAFYRLARRMTFIIDSDGKIRKIFEKVNPNTHVEEIIASLKELQSEKLKP
jgi:thioredoxin-dependent peroxiredoxin